MSIEERKSDKYKEELIYKMVEDTCQDDPKKWHDYAFLMKEFNNRLEAMIIRERHDNNCILDDDFDEVTDLEEIIRSETGGKYE